MSIDVGSLLSYAEQQLGKPYVFGAAGPGEFDCSGLVTYVFEHFGVALPHHSEDQATYGTPVATSQIQAGDLVFSNWGDGPASHVGIAVSPTKVIDAPHSGATVRYDDLTPSYLDHVDHVRRVTTFTGQAPASPPPAPGGGGGSLLSQFEGALNQVTRQFTGPYQEIAQPLQDIGSAATEIASISDKLLKLFLPTNFLRIVCGIAGVMLILLGIWFLSREARG